MNKKRLTNKLSSMSIKEKKGSSRDLRPNSRGRRSSFRNN